jgi:hypothetical protein
VGQRGHSKSRGISFSLEKEKKIISREHDSLYTTE